MNAKILATGLAMAAICTAQYREWSVYGGGPDSIRYSRLNQINKSNVKKLKVAWTHDTGDAFEGSEIQCNPIIVDGVMYATTPKLRVIALDAATGKEIWSFQPEVRGKNRNRGLTYWASGDDRRIYVGAVQYLYALNAKTGKLVESFGEKGRIDLRRGLGRNPERLMVRMTTPGVIYKDLLITGFLTSEALPAAPGFIRAFDVRSGALKWTFHTIPQPGEFGYNTWPAGAHEYMGGANNWAGMALDEGRGIVYVPTGSAAYDFYGSNRHGDNLFANCLLALKAETGERLWHFQFVKHDVWDRDLPAPPTLVTVRRNGKKVDAVAQITKSGHVFVFDRVTGAPLFPVEYREVPASEVDGERLAATQPFPVKPPPFARQTLTEEMLTKRTPEANRIARERLRSVRSAGQFTPPSFEGSVVFPGYDGGGEWGGAGFDPETGLLYVNANEMPWVLRIVPRAAAEGRVSGRTLYVRNCAACHREDLGGSPPEFPALKAIGAKRGREQVLDVIRKGAGRMPGLAHIGDPAVEAITSYLMSGKEEMVEAPVRSGASPYDLKYATDGYNKFLDPDGYPAVEPPWGTLNAIDLNKGEIAWKIPFGELPELMAKGMKPTGTENYGGPVVTAGGLLLIGATNHDRKFRAFDKKTGKLLWETTLPAAGNATPATYEVNGKQYVVIACGGGKSGAPSGGSYVAFALP
ncbi:MAG: PQQ-binding-like beta-propeller repeat protein [Bryobacteraceae bacterium]